MVNVEDYKNTLGVFFRDILRGVDSSGTANGYTTFVHHPNDYESDGTTLKDPSEWVDRRSYIIYGKLKEETNDISIQIIPADIGTITPSSQGAETMDLIDGVWKAVTDTTAAKSQQRYWRDKIAAQILKTYTVNYTDIFEASKFLSFNFGSSNTSLDTDYSDELRLFVDTILDI